MSASAYLTQRGVILVKDKFPLKQIEEFKKELTVSPFVQKEYQFNCKSYEVFLENDKKIAIPRFFAKEKGIDFSLEKMPLLPKRPSRLKFHGELRQLQIDAKNAFLKANDEDGGGIISLGTGQGKTVVALSIVCHLQVKTLILVHQSFLMNQWRERIGQFIPEARVGFIQQETFEVDGKDIVIAMIQTVCKRDFTPEQQAQLKSVGMCITDETHHFSSEVFCRALFKVGARSMLGLTATPRRKDKLERVFHWHLGKVVFAPEAGHRRAGLQPIVQFVKYHGQGDDFVEQFSQSGQISVPMMMSKVVKNKQRNKFIIDKIHEYAKDERRHCLVLSDRRKHLQVMEAMFRKAYPAITTGFYVGGMKMEDLKESEAKRVLFATYSMVSEAFDLPSLNTLFMTTARSDIEQSVGRILRKDHIEVAPTIVDICDRFSIFIAQGRKRYTFYQSKGYKMFYSSNLETVPEEPMEPPTKKVKLTNENLSKLFGSE